MDPSPSSLPPWEVNEAAEGWRRVKADSSRAVELKASTNNVGRYKLARMRTARIRIERESRVEEGVGT